MKNPQNTTQNIVAPNKDLATLKQNFPDCFDKNGNFDFEKFKKKLTTKEVNFSKESYGIDWLGKSYARLLATDAAKTLIKEDTAWNSKEENKNSENLLIKGDNLEVLKHLSNAYHEKVKMIYIDPPYNTGSDDFVYEDDRKFTAAQLSELAGVDEDDAKRILEFVNSKSNSHSAWMTFMYPRLYIAKQLLKDDGVIFVSIDDNEVAQLRILMDEIFGEENFRGAINRATGTTTGQDAIKMGSSYDSCLCYSKSIQFQLKGIPLKGKDLNRFNNDDNDGRGEYALLQLRKTGNADRKEDREAMFFPIKGPDGNDVFPIGPTNYLSRWRTGKNKFQKFLSEGLIVWKENGEDIEEFEENNDDENDNIEITDYLSITNDSIDISKYKSKWKPYVKYYLSERTKQVSNLWTDIDGNKKGSIELKELFDKKKLFENPKPTDFLKRLITISSSSPCLILDFFAGSGTTGDAVMKFNAEYKANGKESNRKYILVQLPEQINAKKNKTAYDFVKNELKSEKPTIFEITKERLIRAGKKIEDTSGFKIFETQAIWEDYEFEAKEFDEKLKFFDENKLSSEDLQTFLTTWKTYDNIPLTESLATIDLDGYIGHYGKGKLYLMDKEFKTKNLKALLNKIDADKAFSPTSIIAFGYHFESKILREIAENISSYANKKSLDIDFITRY